VTSAALAFPGTVLHGVIIREGAPFHCLCFHLDWNDAYFLIFYFDPQTFSSLILKILEF